MGKSKKSKSLFSQLYCFIKGLQEINDSVQKMIVFSFESYMILKSLCSFCFLRVQPIYISRLLFILHSLNFCSVPAATLETRIRRAQCLLVLDHSQLAIKRRCKNKECISSLCLSFIYHLSIHPSTYVLTYLPVYHFCICHCIYIYMLDFLESTSLYAQPMSMNVETKEPHFNQEE